MRILRLIGLAATVGLVLAGAAGGSNSTTYSDAVGDNEARRAADVLTTRLTNDDSANVTFEVTLGDQAAFRQGDFLGVFLDNDSNANTGDTDLFGADYLFRATGGAGGALSFDFCEWGGTVFNCRPGVAGFGTDTPLNSTSHLMRFNIGYSNQKESFKFNFFVATLYTDPATQATYVDVAPNQGIWTYQAIIGGGGGGGGGGADPDGDGIMGAADKCPSKAAGNFDGNTDGCPGPFIRLRGPKATIASVSQRNEALFQKLWWEGAPPGTKLVLKSGGLSETFKATGKGVAASKRFTGRPFHFGSVFTLRATREGYAGYYAQLKLGPSGLVILKHLCIPAVGDARPTRCP